MTGTDTYLQGTDRPLPPVVFEEYPLRIRYLRGRGRNLVVVFLSVGMQRNREPSPEFYNAAHQDGENHVLFVFDQARSWLNHPGMAERIVETVSALRQDIAAERTGFIGYSMGGFMAIELSHAMPVNTVVAYCPQYSVHPQIVPEEKGWMFFRRQIREYSFPAIRPFATAVDRFFIFHGGSVRERHHWEKFPTAPNVRHFIFADSGHLLPRDLKKRGLLGRISVQSLNNRPRRVRLLAARAGGELRQDYGNTPVQGAVIPTPSP